MYAFSEVEDFDEENNQFSCYLCDAGFKDKVSLRKHVENCGKTFYCAKCNDNFKSKQNLQEHIASVHDGSITVYGNKTQFYCGICQLTFSSKQTYFTHISYVLVAVNDVKEPIFGKKDNVHVRKNNLERASSDGIKKNYFQSNFFEWRQDLYKKEYINEEEEYVREGKGYVHEGKEYVHEGKEYVHKGKEYVHEGKEYVHEEKEYIHEGKEFFHEETKPTYKVVVSSQFLWKNMQQKL